jgi:hypothetical protein
MNDTTPDRCRWWRAHDWRGTAERSGVVVEQRCDRCGAVRHLIPGSTAGSGILPWNPGPYPETR